MSTLKQKVLAKYPALNGLNFSDHYGKAILAVEEECNEFTKLKNVLGVTNNFYEEAVELPPDDNMMGVFKYLLSVDPELYNLDNELIHSMFKYNKVHNSSAKLSKHLTNKYFSKEGLKKVKKYVHETMLNFSPLPNAKIEDELLDYPDVIRATFEYSSTASATIGIGWSFDILFNCMSSTAFNSCMKVRWDSQLFGSNGTLPYIMATTEEVACMYVKKGNIYIGRAIVHFSNEYKTFGVKRLYGSIDKNQINILANWLMKVIAPDDKWFVSDSQVNLYSIPNLHRDELILSATSYKKDGMYIAPENVQHESVKLKCPDCGSYYNSNEFMGVLCTSCFRKLTYYCVLCNSTVPKDEVCDCVKGGQKINSTGYCITCKETKPLFGYTKYCVDCYINSCDFCENIDSAPIKKYTLDNGKEVSVCLDCEVEMQAHTVCRFCGSEHARPIYNYMMCTDCFYILISFSLDVMDGYSSNNRNYILNRLGTRCKIKSGDNIYWQSSNAVARCKLTVYSDFLTSTFWMPMSVYQSNAALFSRLRNSLDCRTNANVLESLIAFNCKELGIEVPVSAQETEEYWINYANGYGVEIEFYEGWQKNWGNVKAYVDYASDCVDDNEYYPTLYEYFNSMGYIN